LAQEFGSPICKHIIDIIDFITPIHLIDLQFQSLKLTFKDTLSKSVGPSVFNICGFQNLLTTYL